MDWSANEEELDSPILNPAVTAISRIFDEHLSMMGRAVGGRFIKDDKPFSALKSSTIKCLGTRTYSSILENIKSKNQRFFNLKNLGRT